MFVKEAILYHLEMPLKEPFKTSYGEMSSKSLCILKLTSSDGIEGYGELDAFSTPWYTEETTDTAAMIVQAHLLPLIRNVNLQTADQVNHIFKVIRGNEMAKSVIETAIWDIFFEKREAIIVYLFGWGYRRYLCWC